MRLLSSCIYQSVNECKPILEVTLIHINYPINSVRGIVHGQAPLYLSHDRYSLHLISHQSKTYAESPNPLSLLIQASVTNLRRISLYLADCSWNISFTYCTITNVSGDGSHCHSIYFLIWPNLAYFNTCLINNTSCHPLFIHWL